MKSTKKLGTAERYFSQKSWSTAELVCVGAIAVFGIIAIFINGGGPIGFPIVLIAAGVLVYFKSTKVRDEEIDQILSIMVRDHVEKEDAEQALCSYDMRHEALPIKGKDGKVRSTHYMLSAFSFEDGGAKAVVYCLNLPTKEVEKKEYTIPKDAKVILSRETVLISGIRMAAHYLECPDVSLKVPVNVNEYGTTQVAEKLHAEET